MFELVVMAEPEVMALVVLKPLLMVEPEVMALVILEPLVMAEPEVMHHEVVVMARPVVNALVLPPALVVVVLARYGPEQTKVPDQPVRYLVYATNIWCS